MYRSDELDSVSPTATRAVTSSVAIRVLVVDDVPAVRDGLSCYLALGDDLEMVGEAGDGEEALQLCLRCCPDVVLMDLRMPRMDGPTAIAAISQRFPRIRCIALTAATDPEWEDRALRAGAFCFIRKPSSVRELTIAIRSAYMAAQPQADH